LENRQLDLQEARSYFVEALHQNSQYIPLHYFIQSCELSQADATELLDEIPISDNPKNRFRSRITGELRVGRIGAVEDEIPNVDNIITNGLQDQLLNARIQKQERSILLSVL
jgi:hypothetical protein